jgi:hypothetical protein
VWWKPGNTTWTAAGPVIFSISIIYHTLGAYGLENLQTVNLQRDFDVLIFTDRAKSVFMNGRFEADGKPVPSRYPKDYSRGMEKKGFDNLMQFVNNGGKVMAWGPSVELFMGSLSIGEDDNKEEFQLPVSNAGKDLATKGLYVPGSLLRVTSA